MERNDVGLDKKKLIKIGYWLIVFFLFFFQLFFTMASTSQIRYEELAESVRNVYWLQNKTIYDGISSNVGWYAILLIIYNLFGFSLNTAKFFRLFFQLISLICLAVILKKYLGKKAWLPLLTIGLSPTFLYFNTFQTSYGIDLQLLPICFFLADYSFKNKIIDVLRKIFFGLMTMIAWLSYPVFVFYLPSLWGLYLWRLLQSSGKKISIIIKDLGLSLAFFLFPFVAAFLYVKDRNLLWYDSNVKSGIFRGAGIIQPNIDLFWQNFNRLLSDFFYKAGSYNFEFPESDFSNFYPVITLLLIFSLAIIIFIKKKKSRLILFFALIIFFSNFLVANFTFDPSTSPGMRRNTGVLASLYLLFTISWSYFINRDMPKKWLRWSIICLFLLLPLHHLLAYSTNLYSLKSSSYYRELWFGFTNSPNEYLRQTLNLLSRQDIPLSCQDKKGKIVYCRYSEIYAALMGSCYWNKLSCKNILGYDPKTNKFVPLKIELWEKYYWPH